LRCQWVCLDGERCSSEAPMRLIACLDRSSLDARRLVLSMAPRSSFNEGKLELSDGSNLRRCCRRRILLNMVRLTQHAEYCGSQGGCIGGARCLSALAAASV